MSGTSIVRISVDESIEKEATEVLDDAGLTVSDAFRLLLIRMQKKNRLCLIPSFQMQKLLPP